MIVAAVGASANAIAPNRREQARRAETAMAEAVRAAMAEGLQPDRDAAEIRQRMLAARDAAMA